jgi:glycosyltransferase involved in cell wall biosynthesis
MNPRISIAIPTHNMPDKDFFLKRCLDSIEIQTFRDYEIVITEDGKMAENTNSAISKAKGEIIKILFMDDFFAHEKALENIVNSFEGGWLATGCVHARNDGITYNPHFPSYNHAMHTGINSIGSPSVVAFENWNYKPSKSKSPSASIPIFDTALSYLLDCDLYKRLYERYGEPTLLNDMSVVICIHGNQTSNVLTDAEKQEEFEYMKQKYS